METKKTAPFTITIENHVDGTTKTVDVDCLLISMHEIGTEETTTVIHSHAGNETMLNCICNLDGIKENMFKHNEFFKYMYELKKIADGQFYRLFNELMDLEEKYNEENIDDDDGENKVN